MDYAAQTREQRSAGRTRDYPGQALVPESSSAVGKHGTTIKRVADLLIGKVYGPRVHADHTPRVVVVSVAVRMLE